MTTIAWDGTTLAADRQCTNGGTPMPATKLFSAVHNGRRYLYGLSGTEDFAVGFRRWCEGRGPQPDAPHGELTVLCVDDKGRLWWAGGRMIWTRVTAPKWATGSGADYALGAMHAGASAVEAVRIASRLDVNTGLGVQTLTRTAMKPVPMKPAKKPGKKGKKGC